MKKIIRMIGVLSFGIVLAGAAKAAPQIGQPAPDFTATDSNGKTVHLSDFKGKEVVLEWSNNECPFVKKWYGSGGMQALQKEAANEGIIWLTVLSSAPGQQGFVSGQQANDLTKNRNAEPAFVLMDGSGAVGHAFGALTTPDMYVVDKAGILQYMGGADSIASTDIDDLRKAEPYAREAMNAVATGQKVSNPVTRPYGCNVKY